MYMNPYIKPADIVFSTRSEKYQKLVDYLELKANESTVIDIGCGEGIDSLALAHHFHAVYGIDPSVSMLKAARKNRNKIDKKNVRFYKGSVSNPYIKTADVVFVKNVLHMVEFSIPDLLKHVNPGGYLIIQEPKAKGLQHLSPIHRATKLKQIRRGINALKKIPPILHYDLSRSTRFILQV